MGRPHDLARFWTPAQADAATPRSNGAWRRPRLGVSRPARLSPSACNHATAARRRGARPPATRRTRIRPARSRNTTRMSTPTLWTSRRRPHTTSGPRRRRAAGSAEVQTRPLFRRAGATSEHPDGSASDAADRQMTRYERTQRWPNRAQRAPRPRDERDRCRTRALHHPPQSDREPMARMSDVRASEHTGGRRTSRQPPVLA